MSGYQPQRGDRVRVVLEGDVTATYPLGAFDVADRNAIDIRDSHVVSVEKVAPPLPTAPGSVISGISGALFARSNDGQRWIGLTGGDIYDEFPNPGAFEVLYDAGAES